MKYPHRPQYFALKFQRYLAKICEMQNIGTDGYALLSLIVNLEDCRRYKSPVSFFNFPLQNALGFRKWERLDNVRRRLVERGWLHYEPPPSGSRGRPGIYWVTVPDGIDLESSTTLDEHDHIPQAYTVVGYGDGYGGGDGGGEPSCPNPIPVPILSQPSCDAPAKSKKTRQEYPPDFEAFWTAYPTRDGRRNGKGAAFAAWKRIAAADRLLVQQAAAVFATSKLALDGKARDPERFLKADWWRDWLQPAGVAAQPSQYAVLMPRRPRT